MSMHIYTTASKYMRFLPLLVLLLFVILHIARNDYFTSLYDNPPNNRHFYLSHGEESREMPDFTKRSAPAPVPVNELFIIEVTPTGFLRRTGPWYWRFFQWGIRTDRTTRYVEILNYNVGFSMAIARAVDITNPTPFMLFVISCIFSLRKHRRLSIRISEESRK